jgi:nucleoside-diphosphate kinase
MTSGPVIAMLNDGQDAIAKLREVVGATDPKKAAVGTIRQLFGKNVTHNAIHASDSVACASRDISFFFTPEEIYCKNNLIFISNSNTMGSYFINL